MFQVGDLVVVKQTVSWAEDLFGLIGEVTTADTDGTYSVDFGETDGEILMYERELDGCYTAL